MAAKRSDSPFPFGVCLLSFILTWMFLAAVARPVFYLFGADIESTPGASDRVAIGVILCAAGVGVLVALRTARRRN
jgi:hypothetical protein